jgi:uncharacterized membrane protein
VGAAYGPDIAWSYAYVYNSGGLLRLNGPAGASSSWASGISETGAVVGGWTDPNTLVQSWSADIDPVTGEQTLIWIPATRGAPVG